MSVEDNNSNTSCKSPLRDPYGRIFLVLGWLLSLVPLLLFFDASQSSETATGRWKSFVNSQKNSQKAAKPHGSFSVEILSETASDQPSSVYKLKGIVVSRKQTSDVVLEWVLPKDGSATLTKGQTIETIGAMPPGATHETHVELTVHSSENVKVHLNVVGIIEGQKLGGIAQFNSVQPKPEKNSLIQKQNHQKKRLIQ